jgi:hypothetical protein
VRNQTRGKANRVIAGRPEMVRLDAKLLQEAYAGQA